MSRYSLGDEEPSKHEWTTTASEAPSPGSSTPISVGIHIPRAKKLSSLPIYLAGIFLVLSTILMVLGRAWPLPLVGWLLTPFAVVGCLMWARILMIRGLADPLFDQADARRKQLVLQLLTFVAFIASAPHIWRIGQEAALWLQ